MRFHISKQGTIMVIIQYNNTKLGKRYVVKKYKNWELIETYPYDRLEDIKLKWFILKTLQHGKDKTNDPRKT